jgi:hypothetical protein
MASLKNPAGIADGGVASVTAMDAVLTEVHMSKSKARKAGVVPAMDAEAAPRATDPKLSSPDLNQPRGGSKQARLVDLLGRAGGATIDDLTAATGWLPHTARAALTGLRKRGFAIGRVALEGGGSSYRIATPEPEPAPERKRGARARRSANKAPAEA